MVSEAGLGAERQTLTLDQWLADLKNPGELTVTWSFPTDPIKDAYLDSIAARTEGEVRDLLRGFLMPTGFGGFGDRFHRERLQDLARSDPEAFSKAMASEFNRRLVGLDPRGEPAWQGVSWVLDLLPRWPMHAIEVIEAYFLAHMMQLPDGRIHAIGDAQAVIRAMWIGNPTSGVLKRDLVLGLGPRRFEHLIERLYSAMGYSTTLTVPSRDGGRDVEVTREIPGRRERSIVECKLWTKPVGVQIVRQLLGVVAHEVSTKGVLAAASTLTTPAREMARDPRLELLGWEELLPLLDQHLGADWGRNVDRLIGESIRHDEAADV